MRVTVFSAKAYDRLFLDAENRQRHELVYLDTRLTGATAALAKGSAAVCLFVNDHADAEALQLLAANGVRLVTLRCTGKNNVDLAWAKAAGLIVSRVPAYSPHAVAEHCFALLLALMRKLPNAFSRVREGNFALDGLLGGELHGQTFGIIGVGAIGSVVARIANGFGCTVLGSDPAPRSEMAALVTYVSLDELFATADIVSLHCPLTQQTQHLINPETVALLKPDAVLVNTSRGAVVDTRAVIKALKQRQLGGLAIDVYEEEEKLFFEDRSGLPPDPQFQRLLTFPNVVVTAHQAFFTGPALRAIAAATLANIDQFAATGRPAHPVDC